MNDAPPTIVIEPLLALLRRRYSDWQNFSHPAWTRDERTPKRLASLSARDELSSAHLDELLADEHYEEFVHRLQSVGNASNLLWRRVPSQGDLGVLQHANLDLPAFCLATRDLLHGHGEASLRLDAFDNFLRSHDLPRKWTFPTYFLWLLHPERELFVQPATWKWLTTFLNEPQTWSSTPDAAQYANLRALATRLLDALRPLGAEDLLDVQSVARVAHAMSRRGKSKIEAAPHESRFSPRMAASRRPRTATPPVSPAPMSLSEVAQETNWPESQLQGWIAAIERRGAAIFYGPPGVGKTYLAERLARHLAGESGTWERVQFHPAFAYEEWMQGLRPVRDDSGALHYDLVPGRFLDFCERAVGVAGRCVLLVDEINRADLSRVLGETLLALEYRGAPVPLAGGGDLIVPANVRVIGTMNTADRALSPLDAALRRRFALLPLSPNYHAVAQLANAQIFNAAPLLALLQRVNDAINEPSRMLGTSYFLRPNLNAQLENVWRFEVEPALQELFWDDPSRATEFAWERVCDELS